MPHKDPAARRAYREQYRAAHPRDLRHPPRRCPVCGVTFCPCDTDTGRRSRYCSAPCAEKSKHALHLIGPLPGGKVETPKLTKRGFALKPYGGLTEGTLRRRASAQGLVLAKIIKRTRKVGGNGYLLLEPGTGMTLAEIEQRLAKGKAAMTLTEEMSVTMATLVEAHGGDPELVRRVLAREPVTVGEVKAATGMTGE